METGDGRFLNAGAVPDLEIDRKIVSGMQIGKGPVNTRNHEVVAIGRDKRCVENGGLADEAGPQRRRVHPGKLRGGIVLEEIFVVRVLQHVLISADGAGTSDAFLNVWAFGHGGFGRHGRAIRRHQPCEGRAIIAHPFDDAGAGDAWSEASRAHPVDANARHLTRVARGRCADPKIDGAIGGVGEGEARSIGRPGGCSKLGLSRKLEWHGRAVGKPLQFKGRIIER